MNIIGNFLWVILGGFLVAILYLFGSLILFLTIVGIPFGIQTLKLASLALFPFGREAVRAERSSGCLYVLLNVIWLLVAGIEIAIIHLILAAIFAITIVGIPFAAQHIKLTSLALTPFGMDLRDKS
jgi:uncharacterized membrane protein YccF (DUF307 family)